MLLLLIKQIRSPIILVAFIYIYFFPEHQEFTEQLSGARMFLFPKQAVYANDLQLVNRNQIPMVYKGRNHGILAYFTQLKSATSENNTVGERLVE